MKIYFISDGDPNDNRLWSGTVKQMYTKLKLEHEVSVIDVSNHSNSLMQFHKCLAKIIRMIFKKKYNAIYSIANAKRESKKVEKCVFTLGKADAIFCPAKSSSIAYTNLNIPIIYLTDATFSQMIDYYEHLTNLSKLTVYEGERIEQRAIDKSSFVICASSWTQESIIKEYKKSKRKTKVIPFGANIDEIVSTEKIENQIKLLFCGIDWNRKGGTVAVETVKELQSRNINAHLYIVGCKSPQEYTEFFIHSIGFLDKNKENEREQLKKIYSNMNFLLLPTVAECAGIVFAEASGYGIPSITYDTGGVGTYVIDGVNGFKLPKGSSYLEFADCIERCIKERNLYERLCSEARKYYASSLNWETWEKSVNDILEEVKNERI